MGKKGAKRRKKKREKRKKKRQAARKNRGSRPGTTPSKAALDLDKAADWPLHECYLSSGWNQHEARVHAVISRKHATGLIAAASFEVDLGEGRVIDAGGRADLSSDAFMGLLVQRSSEDDPLVLSEPYLVVKLVTEAVEYGREAGRKPGKAYRSAAEIFGDIDPDRAPDEIPLGPEPTDEVPAEPTSEGLLGSLKKRFFG